MSMSEVQYTPEAPDFLTINERTYTLASLSQRFLAQLLDGLIYAAIYGVFALCIVLLIRESPVVTGETINALTTSEITALILYAIAILLSAFYAFFQDGLGKGQS